VLGVDVDPAAISVAIENREHYEVDNVDFLLSDIDALTLRPMHSAGGSSPKKAFDTVIMNPPFGTKVAGIGMQSPVWSGF
jgi:predicted RNA methylase